MVRKKYGILYHKVDMDGIMSAALVLKYLQEQGVDMSDIELKGWNHGYSIDILNYYEVLYIVDLGIRMEGPSGLYEIAKRADRRIWIDHHITGKESYENYRDTHDDCPTFEGILDATSNKAACQLVLEYLFPNEDPQGCVSTLVKYLSMYDVWDRADEKLWTDIITPLHTYMYTYFARPDDSEGVIALAEFLTSNIDISNIVSSGTIMCDYKNAVSRAYINNISMSKMWGYNVLHINSKVRTSAEFDYSPLLKDADMLCIYVYAKGRWYYTITNNVKGETGVEVDCRKIAETYGGGGHKGAAGFITDHLLF